MLDVKTLILPISQDFPCGSDVRTNNSFNSLYSQLKEERFLAKTNEREASDDSPRAHWLNVYNLSIRILSEQSKDLQVLGWLIEASVRINGFDGLRSCLQLTRLLIETYWDTLHPEKDEDGYEARLMPFIGLNGESTEGVLIFPLLNIPLTQGRSVHSFATWQCLTLQNAKIDPKDTLDITISIKETPQEFFAALFSALNTCIQELAEIDRLFTMHCGHEAPSFNDIKKTLETCLSCLRTIAPNVLQQTSEEILSIEHTETSTATYQPQTHSTVTRESAFQNLLEISNFFQRTEPHSPLPYLLRKAVRWGKMPLTDLLRELVEDQSILVNIYRLTGIEDTATEQ